MSVMWLQHYFHLRHIIFHLRKLILRELDVADLERKLLHNLLTIFFWTRITALYDHWDSKILVDVH